jgi:hypothetical protein
MKIKLKKEKKKTKGRHCDWLQMLQICKDLLESETESETKSETKSETNEIYLIHLLTLF